MAEEEDNAPKNFSMKDEAGNEISHWRSHSGKGSAQYTNGDKYEGDFTKGVIFSKINKNSEEMAKAS